MSSSRQRPPTQKRWLLAFAFSVAVVFVYGGICLLVERTRLPSAHTDPNLAQLRVGLSITSMLSLVLAVIWLYIRVDRKFGWPHQALSPTQFATDSLVALGLSSVCSTEGFVLFFLGASAHEFTYFALGTLIIDFAFVLPRALRFWRAYEASNRV